MMNQEVKEDKIFTYRGKYKWEYFSKKAMKELFPEGGYKVIGEVIEKTGKNREMPIMNSDEKPLYVQPLKTYKKVLYKRIGYIWSKEYEGYVVIKKNNWLLLLLSLLALLLVIGGIFWLMGNGKPNIDPNAGAYESTVSRPVDMDQSKILIPGYRDWNMKEGTDEVYIALYNPKDNPCYFQFNVILDETGETLFKTGLVPPGNAVTTVKLPRNFKEGIYPITLKIKTFALNDYEQPLNGGEVKVNIVALKESKE